MFSTCDGNSYVRREKVISGCLYSLPSVQHKIPWLKLEIPSGRKKCRYSKTTWERSE